MPVSAARMPLLELVGRVWFRWFPVDLSVVLLGHGWACWVQLADRLQTGASGPEGRRPSRAPEALIARFEPQRGAYPVASQDSIRASRVQIPTAKGIAQPTNLDSAVPGHRIIQSRRRGPRVPVGSQNSIRASRVQILTGRGIARPTNLASVVPGHRIMQSRRRGPRVPCAFRKSRPPRNHLRILRICATRAGDDPRRLGRTHRTPIVVSTAGRAPR
jgi:hypothetical protein